MPKSLMRYLTILLSIGSVAASGFTQQSVSTLQHATSDAEAPIVDLGYARYQGYYNSTFDLNVYRGIRFAAPPKRWQLPQPPEVLNRTAVIPATSNPPRCPQSLPGPV